MITGAQRVGQTHSFTGCPANYSVQNAGINSIKIKKKVSYDDNDSSSTTWEINILSGSDKLKFKTGFDPKDTLQKIYGNRVK